jgi:hypothetical protein
MKLNESQKQTDKREEEERPETSETKKKQQKNERWRTRSSGNALGSRSIQQFSSVNSGVQVFSRQLVKIHSVVRARTRMIKLASMVLPLFRSPSVYYMQQLVVDWLLTCRLRGADEQLTLKMSLDTV